MAGEALNVVVCGTCFGEHYLAAIARLGGDVRLAGILARGGARMGRAEESRRARRVRRTEQLRKLEERSGWWWRKFRRWAPRHKRVQPPLEGDPCGWGGKM